MTAAVDLSQTLPARPMPAAMAQALRARFAERPIQIASSPSRSQVAELIDFVDRYHRQGVGTAVHCTSGLHRTGTMLAAYLILNGSTSEDAIQKIATANSQAVLELAQTVFLRSLAAGKSNS